MSGLDVQKIQVFDPETGAPLMVAEKDVPALAAQGKVTFQKGQQLPLQDSAGVAGTVPAEQAQQAFQQGYGVQPEEQRAQDAMRSQYGDTSGEIKAALAGAARGVSLGTSDLALTKMGVVDPETLEYLKKANPGISTASEIAGAALPALASDGGSTIAEIAGATPAGLVPRAGEAIAERVGAALGSAPTQTLAAKIAKAAAARSAGSAIEGSLYSAGNALSEASLGDPDSNAHHVAAEIGMGALIGGIFGVGAEGASMGLSKLLGKRVSQEATEVALRDQIAGNASAMVDTAPLPGAPQPGSLQEVIDRVASAKSAGESVEMPQKEIVLGAEKMLAPELKYPMIEAQVQALNDPKTYDIYRAAKESSTQKGRALVEYEALQKRESVDLLNNTVDNIAPTSKITADPAKAGTRLVEDFSDQYTGEQKKLGSMFKKFDEVAPNVPVNSLDVVNAIKEVIPDAEKMLKMSDGAIQLQPYSAAQMGVSESTYKAVSHIFKPLTEEGLTVAGLRNLRGTLEDFVTAAPGAPGFGPQVSQIRGLKSKLLDLMSDKMDQAAPELNARDFFKKYAVNEQNRGYVEKLLGGSISDKAGLLKQIAPEKVGDRIFRDTVAVRAAKQVLSPDAFNEMRANYLAEQLGKFTDKGAFRSQPFASWVKNNASELAVAFEDKPQVLQKIQALADRMRILPDAPSINPSGTAKTADLLRIISGVGHAIQHPLSTIGKGLEKSAQFLDTRAKLAELDHIMARSDSVADKEIQYGVLKKIENASKNTSNKIKAALDTFFTGGKFDRIVTPALAIAASSSGGSNNSYMKLIESSAQVQAAPGGMVDHLGDETADVRKYAPKIADSMASLGTQAAGFLASKAPKNPYIGNTLTPQLHDWAPNSSDLAQFKRYADAVYHPLSILNHLNDGTVGNEEIETLKTVYPKIYDQISREMLDQITDLKEPLPYKKRVTISKLLGMPYESTLRPDVVAFLQSNHLGAQEQEMNGGMPNNSSSLSQSGLSKLDKAQSLMTDTQRVQSRGA